MIPVFYISGEVHNTYSAQITVSELNFSGFLPDSLSVSLKFHSRFQPDSFETPELVTSDTDRYLSRNERNEAVSNLSDQLS